MLFAWGQKAARLSPSTSNASPLAKCLIIFFPRGERRWAGNSEPLQTSRRRTWKTAPSSWQAPGPAQMWSLPSLRLKRLDSTPNKEGEDDPTDFTRNILLPSAANSRPVTNQIPSTPSSSTSSPGIILVTMSPTTGVNVFHRAVPFTSNRPYRALLLPGPPNRPRLLLSFPWPRGDAGNCRLPRSC